MNMSKEKYKTRFSSAWKDVVYQRKDGSTEVLSWLQPVHSNPSMAKCGICLGSKPFSISNGGIAQVKQHAETVNHSRTRKSLSGQCTMSERGFSINKKMLDIHDHGSSTKEETIVALRFIKDELIHRGGPLKIPLTKELLKSCRNARSSYFALMKHKQKEQDEALKEKEKEKASKREVLDQLKRQLDSVNTGISVALKAVEDGNMEMGEEMQKKKVDMDKLKLSQSKVAMGMKRKSELEVEADKVKKKMAETEEELK